MPQSIRNEGKTMVAAEKVHQQLLKCTTHEQVLDVMTGVPFSVFVMLDEKPGYFGYEGDWHSRLRQVRNNPDYNLFERLGK